MTGDELKKYRNQMALTQTQLAAAIDRTRDMIEKNETGKYPITQKMKEKIWAMARGS